jgi:NADH dehydrogenase
VFKDEDRQQFAYSYQPTKGQPRVVILGGGFGGLAAARALSREPVRITLVDRRNHHLFQPLLYQVATAALAPSDIALPIRRITRGGRRISVILGEATSIDVTGKKVVMRDAELEYDYLIVATGATHSYFGHNNWAEAAPGLKTLGDATEIRRRVLVAYEAAGRADDLEAQRRCLTFVIVGGRPTGVELAGALAEISHRVLSRDFSRIRSQRARIDLVEAASRVLPSRSEESSRNAERQLKRIGVELMLNTMVTGVDDAGVAHGQRRIASHTVIWAAGVAASTLGRSLDAPTDKAGRVLVSQDLSVPKSPDVFVIGDFAAVTSRWETFA